jgi:hypothetical protein
MLLRFCAPRYGLWLEEGKSDRSYFCWIQLDVAAKPLAAECMVIWFTVFAVFSQAA